MGTDPSPFERLLLSETVDQLQQALEQTARSTQAFVLTNAEVLRPNTLLPDAWETNGKRFVLVISEPFSALLCAHLQSEAVYQTELSFDPDAIRLFVQALLANNSNAPWHRALEQASAKIRLNDAVCQSQFTLLLVSLLTLSTQCQSTETALRQQIEQERLQNQVTTQIRQSLELPVILKTAVEQVRQFLQVDRLVIYQLDAPTVTPLEAFNSSDDLNANCDSNSGTTETQYGSVIYEARASETIPSVMHLSDAYCLVQELRRVGWNTLEIADAIEDVEVRYRNVPCLLEFLRQAQVRAKLIAPIRLQNHFWGLLIAHECHDTRQWQDNERRFLQQIAENLAIAISQAQLFAEVQKQKQTLEHRVIERTQALQDAMLAAQTANRAKSEFLAMVSHELRTPLACIIGMSATLQRWSKDVLTERQQNFLQTIYDSGEHLLSLINDILDLSQAEAGRMVLNLQEFSLSRLAQQTLKAFEGQANLQDIDLELDLHVDASYDRFIADPRRVRQILFNLLGNAVKFTPEGGRVTLRVFAQADLAVFQVKDTGIGIPELQLPLLFQKFQQIDFSYQREYQGTGLGLALTKQLVELHGGWIEAESTVGVGSIFTVKLPRQKINPNSLEQSTSRPVLPEAEPALKQSRVVLIEPNEESASLICDLLLAAGYQVVWILEGLAALNQIEVLLPAAIILNVQLPDINGDHLIRNLRQNPGTKHLKLLALIPSTATEAEIDQWQTAGANATLRQPFRPDALLQKLRMLIM